jgi:hypothetical protein
MERCTNHEPTTPRKGGQFMTLYRKREIVPEDTQVHARIAEAKIVSGQYGRQVQVDAVIVDEEYRGVVIRDWFNFSTDESSGQEYITYGGRLFHLLLLAEPNLDNLLLDAKTDKEVDRVISRAVRALKGVEFMSRTTVKKPDSDRPRNAFDAATMGRAEEPPPPF